MDHTMQKNRDQIKNKLCDRFDLPFIRINANYLDRKYRGLDLLTYFVEVWFMNEAFDEMQKRGAIPWDEGFDPYLIISDGTGKKWPYWLSADIQVAIIRLEKQGLVSDTFISHWVGVDKMGNYRCLCWLQIPNKNYVIVETGMREQRFPVIQSELVTQLAAFEIYEKVADIIKGKGKDKPESENAFMKKLKFYKNSYDLLNFCGYSEYH